MALKIIIVVLALALCAVLYARANALDWRTAPRESAGIAPLPAAEKRAVVQVYAARAFNWRGWFAVHTWLATKEANADHYIVYQVMGWALYHAGTALSVQPDIPDRLWFGARPVAVETLIGDDAARAIPQIARAAYNYPYPNTYRLWPGPNSNTFTAHVLRSVPALTVELPPTAIGRDWLGGARLFAKSETGTGVQFSLWGVLGFTIGRAEGIEINLFGLTFGIDFSSPALKLPFIGRIGMTDRAL